MKQIEKGLFELHATYSKVQSESQDVKETRITEEKKTETSPVLVKY